MEIVIIFVFLVIEVSVLLSVMILSQVKKLSNQSLAQTGHFDGRSILCYSEVDNLLFFKGMQTKIYTSRPELIKLRKNFQLTLPKNIREKIWFEVGSYAEVTVHNGKITIRPVKADSSSLTGGEEMSQLIEAGHHQELVYEAIPNFQS